MAVNLHQTHFRFGVDELAESTHGWLAAEDANASKLPNQNFLLRFTVQETGGTAAANVDNQFQYNKNGAGWNNITTTSAVVKAVAADALTNGGNCTKRLTGTGTFETTAAGQTEDGLSGGPANDIAASGNSETECGLQIVGADVARFDTIQFRLTSPDFPVTVDVTPTLTVLGNVALAADASALALTGSTAALKAGLLLSANAGAIAVNGTAAALLRGYPLPAGFGAYALNGSAADLVYTPNAGAVLTADGGALTLTGTAAALKVGHAIVVSAGALALAGQVAALNVNKVLTADSGSVALTGSAANVTAARLIAGAAGNYILSGTAAALRPSNVRMEAEQGVYLITGAAARAALEVDMLIGGTITTQDKQDIADEVRIELAAELAKIAALSFTLAGKVDAHVQAIRGRGLKGSGTDEDPWGPE